MMQTMRNSAKIIFFIVLVTFVGFMAWGGAVSILSSKSRSGGAAPPGVIGRVNGTDINSMLFDEAYRQRLQALTTDEHEPTDDEMAKARNDIWSNMTTMALLEQEAQKHGVVVTDRDVAAYMRQAPPREILESKDFQANGQFDFQKYQTWLQQLAASDNPQALSILSDFEKQIRQQLLVSRLQDLIVSTVRITPDEVKEEMIEKADKVKVQYFFIPAGDFDSTITTVPESEVKARYEKDKEQFKQPEMAILSHVQIAKAPSETDAAVARKTADSLSAAIKAGADFAELATKYSQDPGSGQKGGDLGWFTLDKMVQQFSDATKAIRNIGDVAGPVQSQFGYHIIKLTGRRTAKDAKGEEKPEYQASHILIKVEPSSATLAELEQKANNFKSDAEKLGFKESAEDFGLTVAETKPFPKGQYVPEAGQNNQALNDFSFNGKIGEVSDVIPSRNSFIVFQIARRTPAGYTPYAEVKDRLEKTILREKKIELAHKRGEELSREFASGKSFEQVAQEAGKTLQETDYFNRSQFVPKIGTDPDFAGAAFSLSFANPVSKAVNSRTGTYFIKFVDRQKPDSSMAAVSDSLMNETVKTKRKDVWNKWIAEIKQKAKIEDFRNMYYGS